MRTLSSTNINLYNILIFLGSFYSLINVLTSFNILFSSDTLFILTLSFYYSYSYSSSSSFFYYPEWTYSLYNILYPLFWILLDLFIYSSSSSSFPSSVNFIRIIWCSPTNYSSKKLANILVLLYLGLFYVLILLIVSLSWSLISTYTWSPSYISGFL